MIDLMNQLSVSLCKHLFIYELLQNFKWCSTLNMTLKETRLRLQSGKCSTNLPVLQKLVQGYYVTSHHSLLLFTDTNRQIKVMYLISSIPPAYAWNILFVCLPSKKLLHPSKYSQVLCQSPSNLCFSNLIIAAARIKLEMKSMTAQSIKVAPQHHINRGSVVTFL